MQKCLSTQKKINTYIDFFEASIQEIDNDIWKYLEKKDSQDSIPVFNRINPSDEIKNNFIEIIELCALRLQDLARLCLQITKQPKEILQKPNLVIEYQKLIQDWNQWNNDLMSSFEEDCKWTKMIKELRNEWWRHLWWDKYWRELIFYDIKIDFLVPWKPLFQMPSFEFTWSEWIIYIDDFKEFFEILTSNIFDISIDRLILAYAKQLNITYGALEMLIQSKRIKNFE